MNGSDWRMNVVKYLLGASDRNDQAAMQAYIESGDQQTVHLVQDVQASLERLFDALDPIAPRRQVKRAVMQRIHGSLEQRGGDTKASGSSALRLHDSVAAPGNPGERFVNRFRFPASMAAVLALLLVSIAAIVMIQPGASNTDSAAAPPTTPMAPGAASPTEFSNSADVLALLTSYFDFVSLKAETPGSNDSGRLLWDRHHDVCYVFAPSLFSNGGDNLFDLRITPQESESFVAGQFNVDASGWSWVHLDMPASDVAIAKASVVRQAHDGAFEPIEELLVGRFPQ